MSDSRGLPSSLTEYVLVWCEDLLQDLPIPARTDLARTLSTMYEGGPWPTRLRIQRLAGHMSGNHVTRTPLWGTCTPNAPATSPRSRRSSASPTRKAATRRSSCSPDSRGHRSLFERLARRATKAIFQLLSEQNSSRAL